jgi:ABC-type sugar transport system ATPase subunit
MFDSAVTAFENMGNEQLIYLSLNGQALTVRRPAQDLIEIGSTLFQGFPQDKMLFIDAVSGKIFYNTQ